MPTIGSAEILIFQAHVKPRKTLDGPCDVHFAFFLDRVLSKVIVGHLKISERSRQSRHIKIPSGFSERYCQNSPDLKWEDHRQTLNW